MKTKTSTIIDAIKDPRIFRPFLEVNGKMDSWVPWMQALRVFYGLPVAPKHHELIKLCTGRDPSKLPKEGFDTFLALTGRRSGKSRQAAVIGAFEAIRPDTSGKLSKGEPGVVPIISPSKGQSKIVLKYLKAIFEAPALAKMVEAERRDGFDLINNTRIEILSGDYRSVRGFTYKACVCDEICFFLGDADSHVKTDGELVKAIKPGLATTGGKLICISSPYAMKGWAYEQWKKNWGNDKGKVLVFNAASRVLNPTLPQSVVDDALADDLASARSEYLGLWRDDIAAYISRDLIESLVVPGRTQSLPQAGIRYSAFVDVASGRAGGDDAALAIAHQEGRKVVIDLAKVWKPPFAPNLVIQAMVEEMRQFNGLRNVTGDNYAAEFVASAFQSCGCNYIRAEKNKSALYAELLPRLCSSAIELLDSPQLISQLAGLERRTRSGGKDIIDHPAGPGHHDDLANAVAGVAAVRDRISIGALPRS